MGDEPAFEREFADLIGKDIPHGNASITPFDYFNREEESHAQRRSADGPSSAFYSSARSFLHDLLPNFNARSFSSPSTWLPSLQWIRRYNRRRLRGDLLGALGIAALAIPQSMAYASVAQLPRVYGLFASAVTPVLYATMGTQTLAIGPILIVSQLIADTIDPLMPAGWTEPELWYFDDKANSTNLGQSQPWAFLKPWEGKKEVPNTNPACTSLLSAIEEEPISRLLRPENAVCRTEIYALLQERYNTLALSMTFLVGLLQLIMGSVGLDFLTHFLSTSVLSGFFNGAALIIALSQVGPLLGFATGRRTTLQDLFLGFVKGLARSRPAHALISTLWVAILLLFKFLGKRYARLRVMRYGGPLVVLLLSVATFEWGDVRGPHQSMDFAEIVLRPQATSIRGLKLWAELLPGAIATALVSLVATIQTGPKRERPHYSHPAAEYRALGLSNLLGSFFHGFVVARSQARTEVATQAGASSPLAGLFSGVVVGAFIFALFPLYGRFQKHAIAAIVFSSAAGLMDLTVMRRLWRVSKKDFFTWLLCFLVSIFAGLRFGLITAVGTALLIVIYHITYPNTAVLGRIPGTTVYRDVKDFSDARCVDQVLIVRVSAPMFFANMQFVRDKIAEEVDAAMHRAVLKGTRVEFLLLELSPVTRVDATALASLREIWEELDTIDVVLVLVNPNLEVMRSLHASGVAELIGREFIFVRCHDAVRYCLAKLDFLRDVENIEEATSYGIG